MSFSVLVLHGPNLSLLAEEEIDPLLRERASRFDVELVVVQANGEQGLLDALHEHREQMDAVLVNPGALAPLAFALAEGLQMSGLPVVEVLLKALAPERGASALTGVVKQQVHGLGVDGYVRALELLAPESPGKALGGDDESEEDVHQGKTAYRAVPSLPGKSIGRKPAPPVAEAAAARGKTIGRAPPAENRTTVAPAWKVPITRGQVSERIKRRLKAEESAEALAQWAREQWTAIQRGDPCEPGAKETIENVLLTLMAGAKASDQVLVAQMAKLDR